MREFWPICLLSMMRAGVALAGANRCGEPSMPGDGSYESGVCWSGPNVIPPEQGAFATCGSGDLRICAVVLEVTRTGFDDPAQVDVIVWQDEQGEPGTVLYRSDQVSLGPISEWPAVSRVTIPIPDSPCVSGDWWVGFFPRSNAGYCSFYLAADSGADPVCSMSRVPEGEPFPAGWGPVALVWPEVHSIAIGVETTECGAVATSEQSWGRVKSLYGRIR